MSASNLERCVSFCRAQVVQTFGLLPFWIPGALQVVVRTPELMVIDEHRETCHLLFWTRTSPYELKSRKVEKKKNIESKKLITKFIFRTQEE